jgi:type II secretory pathway component GspD/PulD (secretin)
MVWRNARIFSGQLSADDFRLAMSAFEEMEDTKIFSNPKIIVSNGKEALFDRTTKFPNVTLTSQHDTQSGYTKSDAKLEVIPGEDGLFAKTAFFSWGITLSVKPRISPDGLISVEIVPSISDLDRTVTSDGFYHISGGSDAPYGSYPILLFKRLTTEFTMKDGATAVIGGLSKTEEGDVDSGIPYLRKIPWIGPKLFGWKSRGKVQKEILIFVTVGIADPANLPEDVGLPKNAVRGREYVQKRAFEPGDRPEAATDILKLDMRTLDERHAAEEKKTADAEPTGSVTITPVVQ